MFIWDIHIAASYISVHTHSHLRYTKAELGEKRKEPQPAAAPSRHLDTAASRTQARDPSWKNTQEKEIYFRRDGVMVCMIIESQGGKKTSGMTFLHD